MDVHLLLCYII